MKRAKTVSSMEFRWPCQSAKDPEAHGLRALLKQHCECAECRAVYNDILRYVTDRFLGRPKQ